MSPDKPLNRRAVLRASGLYSDGLARLLHGPGGPWLASSAGVHAGGATAAGAARSGLHHARLGQQVGLWASLRQP
jgi:hypothetical protein